MAPILNTTITPRMVLHAWLVREVVGLLFGFLVMFVYVPHMLSGGTSRWFYRLKCYIDRRRRSKEPTVLRLD